MSKNEANNAYLDHRSRFERPVSKLFTSFRYVDSANIKKLRYIFDTAPSYGSDINWKGYTTGDAGATLYAYLSSLPDPLIPYRDAEHLWLSRHRQDDASTFDQTVQGLPQSERHLLLYLLRVFHHCLLAGKNYLVVNDTMQIAEKYHSIFLRLDHGPKSDEHAISLLYSMIKHAVRLFDHEEQRQRKGKRDWNDSLTEQRIKRQVKRATSTDSLFVSPGSDSESKRRTRYSYHNNLDDEG